MGLLKKDKAVPQETASIERDLQQPPSTPKRIKQQEYTAKERQNVKVNPDSFEAFKAICNMKDFKQYEMFSLLIDYYAERELSPREQKILKLRIQQFKENESLKG